MNELMLKVEEVALSETTVGKRDQALSRFLKDQGLKPQSVEARELRRHGRMTALVEENRLQHIEFLVQDLYELQNRMRHCKRARLVQEWYEARDEWDKICRQITKAGGTPPTLGEMASTPPKSNPLLVDAEEAMIAARYNAKSVRQRENRRAHPDEDAIRQAELAELEATRRFKEEERRDLDGVPVCRCGSPYVEPPDGFDPGDYAPCGYTWEECVLW